jgi:ABC-type amino acid transport system permease subunit
MAKDNQKTSRQRLFAKFLDPIDRLTEAIYAVLIVMTFTMAYRAIDASAAGTVPVDQLVVRLAIAAFGCAVAWGIIDGAMHVLLSMLERGETNRLLRIVKGAPTDQAAIDAIAGQLDGSLEPIMNDEERHEVYRLAYLRLRDNESKRVGFDRNDFYGALGVMLIAILATLPLIIALLLFRNDPFLALRASNLMAIIMLFYFGYSWAKYTGSSPIKTGLALSGLGVAMVLVAIPLGG